MNIICPTKCADGTTLAVIAIGGNTFQLARWNTSRRSFWSPFGPVYRDPDPAIKELHRITKEN